ncbi:MAG: hypothetical protein JW840_08630 [Candidatus Thermoplasmatota archaeon]|nr:hypothetical protein [Candidatus Thermoplasmatota archaeon]
MSCPYYQDLTRTCIQYFPRVVQHSDFIVCDSERYPNCLAYIALRSGYRCPYQNQCLEDMVLQVPILAKYFIEDHQTIELFKKMVQHYCSSEQNHVNCACFKLWEQGIHPPVELLPNGKKYRLRDLLLKRDIVLE